MEDQQGLEKLLITSAGTDSCLNRTKKLDQYGFAGPTSLKPARRSPENPFFINYIILNKTSLNLVYSK